MYTERKKILVVDDEPDVGNYLNRYLSTRGFEIINAYSGERALKILEEQKVDLVLLDILMHGLNGTVIAKTINEKYPGTKIIIITGHPDAAKLIDPDVAITAVFTKPLGLEKLYDKLISSEII